MRWLLGKRQTGVGEWLQGRSTGGGQAYGHNGRTEKLSVGPWRCGGTTVWCIRARW